jgi:hypothetical protein
MVRQDAEPLSQMALRLEKHVTGMRRTGSPAEILDAANAAADAIESSIAKGTGEDDRVALTTVKRFTFNAAADCWPGWSITGPDLDEATLLGALRLAQRHAALVESLALGGIQRGTSTWLIGAFELALGRLTEASLSFERAREYYAQAPAPGLALLTEGYQAILERLSAKGSPADAQHFEEVLSRIAAGGFEDGTEWIEQLRCAYAVFS